MITTISASVGEGCKNLPADLNQVDQLLCKIRMLSVGSVTSVSRIAAIKRFQEIWGIRTLGKPDGKIDPGGVTIRRLNETATPLKLNSITLTKISHGGYAVTFTPPAPPKPYQLFLGTSVVPGDYIDVTGTNSSGLITPTNLPDLLKLIRKRNAWSQALGLKLLVCLDGVVVTESPSQNLACPVQPHNGKMLPLDETSNGPKLTYQGDSATGPFYGRMLHPISGVDGLFFKYDGKFETSANHRGFDCITYAGTACGAPVTSMGVTTGLAAALGATKCTLKKTAQSSPLSSSPTESAGQPVMIDLENVEPKNIKEFFEKNTSGYYILWSGGHVVIVSDGTVHEFAFSKQGYSTTPIKTWLEPYKETKLTVRKLPGKPALAT